MERARSTMTSNCSRLNQDFILTAVEKRPISGSKTTSRRLRHSRKILKRLKSHLVYGDQELYTSRQFAEGSNKYEEFFCYNEEDNTSIDQHLQSHFESNASSDEDEDGEDDASGLIDYHHRLGLKRKKDSASTSATTSTEAEEEEEDIFKDSKVFQNISINMADFLNERTLGNVQHSMNLLPRITNEPCFHTKSDFALKHVLTNGILQEKAIKLENMNKIFCSQWLSDRQVIFGTKCNKLMVLDVNTKYFTQIPSLPSTSRSVPPEQQCGIHAIQMNPSRNLLATGGKNPNDIAVYELPTLDPLCVGEQAHQDWVFALAWLDDQFLVSGSRDTSLALWKVPERSEAFNDAQYFPTCSSSSIHKPTYSMAPVNPPPSTLDDNNIKLPSFSHISASSIKVCKSAQKVRDLVFNKKLEELAVVSLNGYIHIWSADRFSQKFSRKLPFSLENVCISCHEDYGVYAVGSKSHTTLMDARTIQCVKKIQSKYSGSGIRSLNFYSSLLSIGTGQGTIMFYDMRAGKYLETNVNSSRSASLKVSSGWTFPDEDVFADIYRQKYTPAIYTHAIDMSGTRLFAAGGPLSITLCGNYIGLWH